MPQASSYLHTANPLFRAVTGMKCIIKYINPVLWTGKHSWPWRLLLSWLTVLKKKGFECIECEIKDWQPRDWKDFVSRGPLLYLFSNPNCTIQTGIQHMFRPIEVEHAPTRCHSLHISLLFKSHSTFETYFQYEVNVIFATKAQSAQKYFEMLLSCFNINIEEISFRNAARLIGAVPGQRPGKSRYITTHPDKSLSDENHETIIPAWSIWTQTWKMSCARLLQEKAFGTNPQKESKTECEAKWVR